MKIKDTLALSYSKSKKYVKENKKKSIVGGVILLALVGWGVKALTSGPTQMQYVLGTVTKGDIVSTVSASGQVSATNQVEIKSKNSGDLLSLNMVTGQEVKAGTVLAQVDAKDAYYAYQSAKISYEKLTKPADTVSTIQAENSLDQAKNSSVAYYAEAISDVDDVYIDLPKIIDGLNAMYYTNSGTLNPVDEVSLPSTARIYKYEAGANFDKARNEFDTAFATYKAHTNLSSDDDTKRLLDATYALTLDMTEAIKGTKQTLDYLQNNQSSAKNLATAQSDVNNWLSIMNSHLNKLVAVKNNIVSSSKTVTEKQASLNDVVAGADALDIQAAKLSLDQKASAYSDSFIRAPFDGVIAKVSVKKGDSISSGVAVGTIITKQKIVSIDLNEVDISKVSIGQTADVTFDAIDGLTATGTVVSVDGIGTVSQGVVSYTVQVALNTPDDRILSGMSSTVVIDTNSKKDVVRIPNAAIKTVGNMSFVEVVKDPSLKTGVNLTIDRANIERRKVVLGLADDDNTEVVSGLDEGEKYILKTVTVSGTSAKTTSSAGSLFGGAGAGRAAGGAGFGGAAGGNRTFTNTRATTR